MGRAFLFFALGAWALIPGILSAQEKLTSSSLSEFLARFDQNLGPVDGAYDELINANLPLRNEEGQPLVRRPIEERRRSLAELRAIARQLTAQPQDLVLTAKLVLRTEGLADDLFDLSQMAYDNDREVLGKRLTDLQTTVDHNKELLAGYLLTLAAQKQERIEQLERENKELERRLRQAERAAETRP